MLENLEFRIITSVMNIASNKEIKVMQSNYTDQKAWCPASSMLRWEVGHSVWLQVCWV